MKVLFLESDPMWIYGLPNGFRDLGYEVKVSGELNKNNIWEIIESFKPELIISMGWTKENTGNKVEWIRKAVKKNKIPHIYWATEDPTHTFTFTLPLIKKMQPDFIFTICKERVNYYREMGIKADYLDFGYHPKINYYTGVDEKYKCSIAVVANGYANNLRKYPKHYRIESIKTLVVPLIEQNIRVDFWGRGWEETASMFNIKIPKEWIHGYLDFIDTSKVYSSADIVLGLQNHKTQLTQRTYEILASKGFLLTSDTEIIRKLFLPNKDLVVASTPEDTIKLIFKYLNSKNERDKIIKSGYKSVQDYSYKNRAEYMLEKLKASL